MSDAVLLALAPVAALIALGWGLRRSPLLAETFWPQAERLAYYVLLPALFVHSLGSVEPQALPAGRLAVVLIGATLAVALGVVLVRPWMRVDGAAFTSIFQGSVRFNTYVGVTLAAGLFGTQGVALAALCSAASVPTVNILSILVFARFGATRLPAREVARQIATNPLIVSCLIGLALNGLGIGMPPGIEPALKALGTAALPLGLLCVGAALRFEAAQSWLAPVALASAAKFVALPAATALAAHLVGLEGAALTVALLFQALPTASSAYILSRLLGGDAPLMAGITAIQTVLAALAMPVVVAALDRTAGG